MNTKTNRKSYSRWGRQITDAHSPLTIRVRTPDIESAVCRDHQKCVVANAIKRTRKASFVDVGVNTVIVGTGKGQGVRFKLDALGRQVVRYFDTHKGRAAPTNITLVPPAESQRIGARQGERHGTNRRSGKRAKPTR